MPPTVLLDVPRHAQEIRSHRMMFSSFRHSSRFRYHHPLSVFPSLFSRLEQRTPKSGALCCLESNDEPRPRKVPSPNVWARTLETAPIRSHAPFRVLWYPGSRATYDTVQPLSTANPTGESKTCPLISHTSSTQSVNQHAPRKTRIATHRDRGARTDAHRTDADPKRILSTSTKAMQKNAVKRVVPANERHRPNRPCTPQAMSVRQSNVLSERKRRRRRASATGHPPSKDVRVHKLPSSDIVVESLLDPVFNSFG